MERKYGATEYMPLARSAVTMLFSLGKAYTRQGARGVSPRVGGRRGLYRGVKRRPDRGGDGEVSRADGDEREEAEPVLNRRLAVAERVDSA